MKTPRVADFDPNAKPPPILKSSMDDFPAIQKPPQIAEPLQPQSPVQSVQHVASPPPPLPPVRGVPPTQQPRLNMYGRRKIVQRRPFDIYEDQMETLKHLSIADRMQGGIGSMSAMVREALDDFFAKKKKK